MSSVFDQFALPNGSVLPNRLAKAAMEDLARQINALPD